MQRIADDEEFTILYGKGKTEAILRAASPQEPIPAGDEFVQLVQKRKALGYMMSEHHDSAAHLDEIENKMKYQIGAMVGRMEALGLPFQAMWQRLHRRTQPSALFGIALVHHDAKYTKRLDRLQEWVCRRMLDLTAQLPRARIFAALGVDLKWSTLGVVDAIVMMARIQVQGKYTQARHIFTHAKEASETWTAITKRKMNDMGVLTAAAYSSKASSCKIAEQKAALQRYRKDHVIPALRQWERREWWARQADKVQVDPARDVPKSVLDAAQTGATFEEIRYWAQLCLQRHFSIPHTSDPHPDCRICGAKCAEDARHLLLFCEGTIEAERRLVQKLGEIDAGRKHGEVWMNRILGHCHLNELPFDAGTHF